VWDRRQRDPTWPTRVLRAPRTTGAGSIVTERGRRGQGLPPEGFRWREDGACHKACGKQGGRLRPRENAFRREPGLSSEETIDRLEGAGVANARMRSIRQFLDHPQLEARDRWREFGAPVGPLRGLLPPAMLDGQEPVMAPIPEAGEHNEKILAELGYGDVETRAPRHAGATPAKEA
jgi:hypothetical protein